MRSLNMYNRESRDFLRTILMWADEVVLDGQGRISIAKPLLQFADIKAGGNARIIGALDHIEIWDPEAFDKYVNQSAGDYEMLAERVMGGGSADA